MSVGLCNSQSSSSSLFLSLVNRNSGCFLVQRDRGAHEPKIQTRRWRGVRTRLATQSAFSPPPSHISANLQSLHADRSSPRSPASTSHRTSSTCTGPPRMARSPQAPRTQTEVTERLSSTRFPSSPYPCPRGASPS